MGERIIANKQCPRCGSIYETYDAPSSMMYVAKCKCGYDENLSYFELTNSGIHGLYLIPTVVKDHIDMLEEQLDSYMEELNEAYDVVN
jgi:hypothetical protein